MKSQKGFIQIPLLIAIIAGVLVMGSVGYVGVKQYKNFQAQKLGKEKLAQEVEKLKTEKNQENQQNELENLKKEVEALKSEKSKVVTKEVPAQKPKSKEIIAEELEQYITGVVNLMCGDSLGSGTLWKLPQGQYSVVTNLHVIDSSSQDKTCKVTVENVDSSPVGFYLTHSTQITSWNNLTDVAVLNLYKKKDVYAVDPEKIPSIESLNYKISSLPNCPTSVALGSPVVVVGYPAFGIKQLVVDGILTHESFRIVSNGIISGYDTSVTGFIGKLPYQNYFVSAKIDSGNSGGIAFSKTGNGLCRLGIPTWLNIGNYETQGLVQNIHNVLWTQ